MTEYKLLVAGGAGAGKTSLTLRFVQNLFIEYDPSIEDSYRKQVTIDSENCILDIFDIGYSDEYSAFREHYMRYGHGYVLLYDITSRTSFEEVTEYREMIFRSKDSDQVPMVLVGNKCDLENERQITTQEGVERARHWSIPFFETSAKDKINVDESFFELVREIRRGKYLDKQPKITQKEKTGNCEII